MYVVENHKQYLYTQIQLSLYSQSKEEIRDLNCFFGQLFTDNDIQQPEPVPIPTDAVRHHACLSELQVHVWRSLVNLKKTATRPDQIPFWIWKDHAGILAPAVTKIWNLSLKTHTWPHSWKKLSTPSQKMRSPRKMVTSEELILLTCNCKSIQKGYLQSSF